MGPLTAEKGYDCILTDSGLDFQNQALDFLWTQNLPLKIPCFIWLVENGRILTWDQLQSRGFHGPSRCVLCERNEEDIYHLFLACPFMVYIQAHFEAKYRLSFPSLNSVSSHLAQWFKLVVRLAPYRYLPLFIFWGIWLHRNNFMFENRKPAFSVLISRIEGLLNAYPVPLKI